MTVLSSVVSSGNTGAYMALSKMIIGTLKGISRPALVNVLPCESGRTIMLDLGANIECSAEKLYQFAVMGNAVAKSLLNLEHPKIGILNIGTEKMKGTEVLEETYEMLSKNSNLNFQGFIEGNDITKGTVNVVVTDGFSGNIALKSTKANSTIDKNSDYIMISRNGLKTVFFFIIIDVYAEVFLWNVLNFPSVPS